LKCFICHARNPNINDENNNLKKENGISNNFPLFNFLMFFVFKETNEKSFNPISKVFISYEKSEEKQQQFLCFSFLYTLVQNVKQKFV